MTEIINKIYYVGVNDRNKHRFEGLWPLPNGVSYNSYIIDDEKVALVDTVEVDFFCWEPTLHILSNYHDTIIICKRVAIQLYLTGLKPTSVLIIHTFNSCLTFHCHFCLFLSDNLFQGSTSIFFRNFAIDAEEITSRRSI